MYFSIEAYSKKSCVQELLAKNVYVLHINPHRFSSKPLHFDFFLYWSKLLNFSIPTQDIFSLLSHQFKNNNLDMVSQLLNEGIPVLFGKKKSKNKRDYTTCEFFPKSEMPTK